MTSPTPQGDEPALLVRIAAGDDGAVAEFMERYRPLVWSIAKKQLPTHAVEDAVQEVFLELWRSAERFDPAIAAEATFVGTIARRRVVDQRRRLGRRPESEELLDEWPEERDTLRSVEASDEAANVLAHIELLRPAEQMVLRLAVFEDLSHSQIAARADLPLGTVKSQLRRGMERLRRSLAPDAPPGASEGDPG